MNCPYCQAPLKDDSPRFCAACGRPLGAPMPGAPQGYAQGYAPGAAPMPMGAMPGAAAMTPDGLLPQAGGPELTLYEGSPALVPSLGALLLAVFTLGIALLFYWAQRGGVTYRVTSQRIVIESGLFSKRMEQIALYRIVDYVVERPFGQRLMGTGNIVIEATDKTTPEIRLAGIRTDVVALYERLRVATEADKRARGVRVVDFERP